MIGSLRGVDPRPGGPGRARPPRCCSKSAGSATGCWCPSAPSAQIGAAGQPGLPARPHPRPRGRHRPLRVPDPGRAGLLRGADRRPRGRAGGGAGPAVGALARPALQRAVLADDADALMLVPGIGKKTATRLLVELKTRLDVDLDGADLRLVAGGAAPAARPGTGGSGRPRPGPRCAPPSPGSATGPTRSAMPWLACPPRAPWRIRSAWPCASWPGPGERLSRPGSRSEA